MSEFDRLQNAIDRAEAAKPSSVVLESALLECQRRNELGNGLTSAQASYHADQLSNALDALGETLPSEYSYRIDLNGATLADLGGVFADYLLNGVWFETWSRTMCGVFGFISAKGEEIDVNRIKNIARITATRGNHAHGIAWVDRSGRLRSFKRPGPITRNIGCLDLADVAMLIGHCRYATRGKFEDNANNHPHASDGGWIVHNGTIYNAPELAKRNRLALSSECDSEVLARLIESKHGTLLERARKSVNVLEGPAVMLGLWSRPRRMVVARRGKPLHISYSLNGSVYFGSLPQRLDDPDRVLDNTVRVYTVTDETVLQTIDEVRPCPKRKAEKNPPLHRPIRRYEPAETNRAQHSLPFE